MDLKEMWFYFNVSNPKKKINDTKDLLEITLSTGNDVASVSLQN